MLKVEQTEVDNTVSSNKINQSCKVQQTETIDQIDPICHMPQNSAMMPPDSGGLITLGIVIAGVLTAIAEVLRETSGFIRTWRNDDRDQ